MTTGERIKMLRERANMTLAELGAAVGTTKQTIYKYEQGIVTNIPLDRIDKLADVFGVTSAELCGWAEEKAQDDLTEYLEMLRTRPECRMLFSLTKDATKEDVERAVAVITALRGTTEG